MSLKRLAESLPVDPVFSGWRFRAVVISALLAALGYLAFAVYSGWREVGTAIAQVGVVGLVIVLSLSLLNYGLRFLRWQLYLQTLGHCIPWCRSLQIYLAGFALTTTPGKAGEAFRGVLLKRLRVPYPDSFAAFLSERLSDLIAIVLLTLFGAALYPKAAPLILVGATLAIVLLVLLSQPQWVAHLQRRMPTHHRFQRWIGHGFEIICQASRCHRAKTLGLATILSLIGWAAEAFAFFLILYWMNLDVAFVFAVFVFAISMLAGAISFTPGGLGSTEGVMVGLLAWHGVGLPEAAATTMLIRATTLWFAVILGISAITRSKDQ
ncbi:lysylphosphatidylglycerol synthase transmembrane domain-containing protein [Desulfonatronum sp. SC1]|uniref:lysylphosphatidylglycerol synthase transmembrane domain-containing protein n=1 Tax=Desulfonatronum sp. SC1 TaxID=2109626 RepID=UPI000D30164A|nr:lysylphosphatidylglycerol synthase transmembrane domain-containing protein [Desulfonatronum sp. SC1]PTN33199.1 TIGR00374 family protein [Desulfonatronum sp. SC1]